MSSEEESIGEVDENDLDLIIRGEEIADSENLADTNNAEATEQDAETQEDTENKKAVKPKRVIKNPQPKLNERTLQERKGLPAIQGHFDRVKFKGHGYEQQDLKILLRTYQYWGHRLIPKFTFGDCIARLETLGSKKATQTQVKRIRMGIDFDNNDQVLSENEDHTAGFVDTPNDQFDQLFPNNNEPQPQPTSVPELSEEQMEKIRQNKERAVRLREERLRSIKEKAQSTLQQSDHIISEDNQVSIASTSATASSTTPNDSITINEDQRTIEPNVENEEDNIDNILDFINTDEPTSAKDKNVLESDNEDEPVEDTTLIVRKGASCVVESDEDEESDNINKNKSVNSSTIIDSDKEDENIDIDDILTEINEDDNVLTSTSTNIVLEQGISHSQHVDNLKNNGIGTGLKDVDMDDINKEGILNIDSSKNALFTDKNKEASVLEINEEIRIENIVDDINTSNPDDSENNLNRANTHITKTNIPHTFEKSVSEGIEKENFTIKHNSENAPINHEVSPDTRKEFCQLVDHERHLEERDKNNVETILSKKDNNNVQDVSHACQEITDVNRTVDIIEPMDTTE